MKGVGTKKQGEVEHVNKVNRKTNEGSREQEQKNKVR